MRRELFFAAILLAPSLPAPGAAPASGCMLTGNAPAVTASDIAFNNYSGADLSPKQANGTVQIKCPLGIGLLPSFTVALSAGTSGGYAQRQMAMAANRLGCNIYTTSGYSTVWGDGTGGSVTQNFNASRANQFTARLRACALHRCRLRRCATKPGAGYRTRTCDPLITNYRQAHNAG
jgi:spore coat protein U-like protein